MLFLHVARSLSLEKLLPAGGQWKSFGQESALTPSIQNKANFPFHQPGLLIGFHSVNSWTPILVTVGTPLSGLISAPASPACSLAPWTLSQQGPTSQGRPVRGVQEEAQEGHQPEQAGREAAAHRMRAGQENLVVQHPGQPGDRKSVV